MAGYGGKNCMNCSADLGTAENPSTFYSLNCNSRVVSSSLFPDPVELIPVPRALSTIFNFDTLERVSKVSDSPLKDFESSATSVPICFVCYMVLSDLYRTYTEFNQLRKANSFLGSKLLDLENCFKSQNHLSNDGEPSLSLTAKMSDEILPLIPSDFVKVEAVEYSNPEEIPEYDIYDTEGVVEDEEQAGQGGQVDEDDDGELILSSSSHMKIHSDSRHTTAMETTDNEKRFKCEICQKGFLIKSLLSKHSLVHSGDRPYKCTAEGCTATFKNKRNLVEHERKHSGVEPFKCDLCGKSYSKQWSFRKHMRVHENAHNKHSCPICPRKFPGTWELKQHLLIHEKGRQFECQKCGKKCMTKGNLKFHEKTHFKGNERKVVRSNSNSNSANDTKVEISSESEAGTSDNSEGEDSNNEA